MLARQPDHSPLLVACLVRIDRAGEHTAEDSGDLCFARSARAYRRPRRGHARRTGRGTERIRRTAHVTVEVTRAGTRGREMPRLPRPLLNAMLGLTVMFYRLFGKRARVQGAPLLLLTTVGARSGKVRRTVLGWFPDDGEGRLVVASFAGSARHPAWYFNMAKHPDQVWIEVGGRKVKVQAELLKGAEREAAWRGIAAQSPGYAAYQQQTDRELPVVRLRPEG